MSATEAATGVSNPSNERGLAFGKSLLLDQGLGLTFKVCYQSTYHNGFRFIQSAWANNPPYVSRSFLTCIDILSFFFGHTPEPGFDLIIGANFSGPRNASGLDPSDSSHLFIMEQGVFNTIVSLAVLSQSASRLCCF